MKIMEWLNGSKESIFRFEALQEFNVNEETDELAEYIKSGKIDFSKNHEWHDFIEKKNSLGIKTERVRLVKKPISDYIIWELQHHKETAKHGDKIRIIEEDEFVKLGVPERDFWVIDEEVVLLMNYARNGEYLGFEVLSENIEKYILWKKLLRESSEDIFNWHIYSNFKKN